jgi:adhesin HecA-like repeat protein
MDHMTWDRMAWPSLKAFWNAERGAALVESAIILPVFLVLVGGVCEFGFYLYQEQLITSGVRDAARYLTLTADPNSTTDQTEAKNLAVSGSIDGGMPRVAGWSPADVSIGVSSVDNSDGTYSGGSTVQIVTVSTSFVDPSLGFLGLLGLKKPIISVSHQERFIGGSAQAQG